MKVTTTNSYTTHGADQLNLILLYLKAMCVNSRPDWVWTILSMKPGALRDFKITQFSLGPSASIFERSVGFGSRDPSEFVDTSPKCS